MKTILKVMLVVLIFHLVVGYFLSFWPFNVAIGIVKKSTTSDAIIQNYQWFYDQYNQINAQIANYKGMKESTTEKNGLRMVINTMIGEYNSRSKQINRNLWKAQDLPYQINFIEDK